MRDHWAKCYKIALIDEFNMLVLPDSTKEPAQKVKLPTLVAAAAAGTKKKIGRAAVNLPIANLDGVNTEQVLVEVPATTQGQLVLSTENTNLEID